MPRQGGNRARKTLIKRSLQKQVKVIVAILKVFEEGNIRKSISEVK